MQTQQRIRFTRGVVTLALLATVAAAASCDVLWRGEGAPELAVPTLQLSEDAALLVDPPDLDALALYFCSRLVGSTLCLPFGPPPRKEELQFHFQLVFDIDNPNQIPIPTSEIQVGLHLWPDQTFGELGDVCITLCEAGAADCPIPPEGACYYSPTDIDTLEEFLVAAARGAVILLGEAINGEPIGQDLRVFSVPAGETIQLKVTLSIGIDPMLKLLEEAAPDVFEHVLFSSGDSLDIPYAVAGRIWFNIPYLGRVTVGFGPYGAPPEPALIWTVF